MSSLEATLREICRKYEEADGNYDDVEIDIEKQVYENSDGELTNEKPRGWEEEDEEDFIELRVIDDWLYPSRQKQKVETIGRFRNPPAVDKMPDDSLVSDDCLDSSLNGSFIPKPRFSFNWIDTIATPMRPRQKQQLAGFSNPSRGCDGLPSSWLNLSPMRSYVLVPMDAISVENRTAAFPRHVLESSLVLHKGEGEEKESDALSTSTSNSWEDYEKGLTEIGLTETWIDDQMETEKEEKDDVDDDDDDICLIDIPTTRETKSAREPVLVATHEKENLDSWSNEEDQIVNLLPQRFTCDSRAIQKSISAEKEKEKEKDDKEAIDFQRHSFERDFEKEDNANETRRSSAFVLNDDGANSFWRPSFEQNSSFWSGKENEAKAGCLMLLPPDNFADDQLLCLTPRRMDVRK